ncbi:MAG: hypothetical protein NZ901_01770 [Geminocystis sp.]|nr:hypothetical protein [Geminocystis sp.]MCS7146897.1 hypothetical protein [Geminocystis sp.]MDW8115722.1 hypothetical protein [Geminocystis sp.]MDW8463265.1 hypothetical protein [Geminocystis sp.]
MKRHSEDCQSKKISQKNSLGENLRLFSLKVEYIAGLHSNGKISTAEAIERINHLWQLIEDQVKNR